MSSSEAAKIGEDAEPDMTLSRSGWGAHTVSRIQSDIEEFLLGGPRCFTQAQIA